MNKVVNKGYLNGSTAGRDESLHSGGVISTCKLFFLSFSSFHYRNGHQLFIDPSIKVQNLKHLREQSNVLGAQIGVKTKQKKLHYKRETCPLPLRLLPLWWQRQCDPPATRTLLSLEKAGDV